MDTAKRILALVLCMAICFSFCGCRVRTTKIDNTAVITQQAPQSSQQVVEDLGKEQKQEAPQQEQVKLDESATVTVHKQDNQNANAKSTSSTNKQTNANKKDSSGVKQVNKKKDSTSKKKIKDKGKDKDSGAKGDNPNDKQNGDVNTDKDDDQSNREDLNKTDEETDQSAIQMAIQKYDNLINDHNKELYECQKSDVYFELEQDYKSVNRHDYQHDIILKAGGSNVAYEKDFSKSPITDSWIANKQPTLIVKVVGADVLGAGVTSTGKAQQIATSIKSRSGFDTVPAVLGDNILLLSAQLFDTDAGKKAVMLYLAKAMYADVFKDLDVEKAFAEMSGKEINGIYAYSLS